MTALPTDPILWGNSVISVGFCGTSAQGGAAYRPVMTSVSCEMAPAPAARARRQGGTTGTGGTAGSGGDITAQKVFGQPTLGDTVVNQIVANRAFHPQGSPSPQHDQHARSGVCHRQRQPAHARLPLARHLLEPRDAECTNNGECTSPGTCVITGTRNADISVGQPSLTPAPATATTRAACPPAPARSACSRIRERSACSIA